MTHLISTILQYAAGAAFTFGSCRALWLYLVKGDESALGYWYGWLAIANVLTAVSLALQPSLWFLYNLVMTFFMTRFWWNERKKRKRRKRMLAALGAKSLALLRSLVEKLERELKPSPVRRPVLNP